MLGGVGLVLAPYAYFLASDRLLPGIHLDGILLGGLSKQEAALLVEQEFNNGRMLTLSDGVRSWAVEAPEVGLRVDTYALVEQAYTYGRSQRFLPGFLAMLDALQNGWQPSLAAALDENAARRGLETLASQVFVAPLDASLTLEKARLVERPAVPGYALDIEQTLAVWRTNPSAIWVNGQAPLYLSGVSPQVHDVSQARAEAERLLSSPVQFAAFDPVSGETFTHSVPLEQVASWLRIQAVPDGPQVTLDEADALSYLEAWSADFGPERWLEWEPAEAVEAVRSGVAVPILVRHAPTTYVVESGDTLIRISWRVGMPYWMLLQANPGLDPEALRPGQVLAVPSKDDLLPLPVVSNKRIVISISNQRLRAYQDGSLLWENVISTGIDRSPTQPGIFQVQSHYLDAYASVWDLNMPHFIGIYEAWPGFMNGIHGLPTLSNGQRLWANILGRPASYGCIILGLQEAEQLYGWAETGVVVEIQP